MRILLSVFLLFSFVVGFSSNSAQAVDELIPANMAPSTPRWCTPTLGITSPKACYTTPGAACKRQHVEFMSNYPASSYLGYYDTDYVTSKHCDWSHFLHHCGDLDGGVADVFGDVAACGTTSPAIVSLWCGPNTTRVNESCLVQESPEDPACENGGHSSPVAGNPIQLMSGAKILQATDFTTTDGRLSVKRQYRSIPFGKMTSLVSEPAGLGRRWRLGSSIELNIHSLFQENYGKVSVLAPDGTAIDFKRDDASGNMLQDTHYNNPVARNTYRLEFVGTWPSNLSDVRTLSSQWRITSADDTVWDIKTVLVSPGTNNYLVGRPTKRTTRDGYTQTYSYGTDNQLESITDNLGRTLTFSWLEADYSSLPNIVASAPKVPLAINEIILPDGNKIKYFYEGVDATITTLPQAERLIRVEQVDSADNVTESTTYHYEDVRYPYFVTGITDGRGVRLSTYAYDDKSRAISTTRLGVGTTTISYDNTLSNITRTVTNPLGKVAVYKFQKVGSSVGYVAGLGLVPRVIQFIGVDGEASSNCPASATAITYDANHRMSETTDEEGRKTKYVYDTRGLMTSITRGFGTPEATTTSYTYDPTLRVATQKVEPELVTDYTWDSNGRLTQTTQTDTTSHSVPYSTNGQVRTTAYTYTGTAGLLATIDGPLAGTSDTITYAYTASGYVSSVTNEVGHITQVTTHNGRGQPTSVTDPNGVISDLAYDSQGRLTTVTVDPSGSNLVTAIEYDAVGQITKITRPDGSHFAYVYSDGRNLTSVTSSSGEKIEYTYDAMGNITGQTVKASDNTITFTQSQTFDELGRLLSNIGASNQTTTYAYEKNNNLKSVTDPRTNVYSNGYDAVNRLISEADPEGDTVNYTRDGKGDVATYSDPRNLQTNYVRNGFGDIIRRASPDSGTTDYVRDARGLITQITDPRSVVTNLTYDNAGRVLTKTYPAATAENVSYSYGATSGGNMGIGRLTSLSDQSGSTSYIYDARGNVTQETRIIGGQSHIIAYSYDAADRVTQLTYPSGRIVNYVRDGSGRITSLTTQKDSSSTLVTIASDIERQPLSNLIQSLDYGNGLNDWNTYTNDYELDVLGVYDGSTEIIDRAHTRTDDLNLTNIWDNIVTANNMSFWHNAANQLQNADGPWGSNTYYYDGIGNRTTKISTVGATTTTRVYGYSGSSNRVEDVSIGSTITRAMVYDAAGNIITDTRSGSAYGYTYNNANRLGTVTYEGNLRGTYTYNGAQQLVIRVLSNLGSGTNGTAHFIHDRAGNVIAETDGTGAAGTTREYIWLPESGVTDRPIAVISDVDTASPATYYVHVDHLNRPVMMTDGAKTNVWEAVWSPFGTPHTITGTASLDARFPGQWFQLEASLHYNWHRHYDPSLGRYTQPDPLGFVDGPSVYAYAKNSPQMFVDPDGRQTIRKKPLYSRPASPFNYSPKLDGKTDKYHNFPYSFDPQIWKDANLCMIDVKPSQGSCYIERCAVGALNGEDGVYEIGREFSFSDPTGTVTHRFFRSFKSMGRK